MPLCLEVPVLSVDANAIHRVKAYDQEHLFVLWTIFSKCADSVQQGRRLENLGWRLWHRELRHGVKTSEFTASPVTVPRHISDISGADIPQLSTSVDSVRDDEDSDSDSSSTDDAYPRLKTKLSSEDLEKMVLDIVKSPDSHKMELPRGAIRKPQPQVESATIPEVTLPMVEETATFDAPSELEKMSPPAFQRSGSETTESTCKSMEESSLASQPASSMELSAPQRQMNLPVRIVLPAPVETSRTILAPATSASTSQIPEPQSSPAPKIVLPKKQPKFDFGGSDDSLTDQSHSMEERKAVLPPKKKVFLVGTSSASEDDNSPRNLKSALHMPRQNSLLTVQKKQASFSDKITTRTIMPVRMLASENEQSETEADDVDESAIDDDDDSSDWEDSVEDSGKSSMDDKFFKRVDSKVNLTSRRSLITLMLEQSERAKKLGNAASQSTSAIPLRTSRSMPNGPAGGRPSQGSPNDSDESPLMMKKGIRPPLKPITEVTRTAAQPILTPSHAAGGPQQQAALSPRTTRRNMLATELTASLRRHLVWERQQKSSTANAVLKRRHTSHDVQNLKQYPEQPCIKKDEDVNATSWNQYFTRDAFGGYHSKGW